MDPVPLAVVLSVDPVLRDALIADTLLDLPGALALRYDLDPGRGVLDRVVHDVDGTVEARRLPVEDDCVPCTLRADLLPVLRRTTCRQPAAVVVAPPPATEPEPLLQALTAAPGGLPPAVVLSVVPAATFEADLLGTALLDEIGRALSASDRRSLGEVVAHQVEAADTVLLDSPGTDRTARLLRHLVAPRTRVDRLHAVPVSSLLTARRPAGDPRGDLFRPAPTGCADGNGVWTLDLTSWRALHPGRLLAGLKALGGGRLRGRGHFRLTTRPHDLCGWDGAGGHLQVGRLGPWTGSEPATRIVVTGVDGDRARVAAAFHDALATDAELVRGARTHPRADGLEPWLGPIGSAA